MQKGHLPRDTSPDVEVGSYDGKRNSRSIFGGSQGSVTQTNEYELEPNDKN